MTTSAFIGTDPPSLAANFRFARDSGHNRQFTWVFSCKVRFFRQLFRPPRPTPFSLGNLSASRLSTSCPAPAEWLGFLSRNNTFGLQIKLNGLRPPTRLRSSRKQFF